MGKDETKAIKGIIEELIEDWKKKKVFKDEAVKRAWQKAIGKKASKHAKPSSLRAGRLVVEVDGSGWIYQLTLKKQDILKKLKKSLEDIKIDEIQFRIGDFK